MAGSSDESSSAIPSWQRSQGDEAATTNTSEAPITEATEEDKLAAARRFLDNEEIKSASREKKIEFLKTKRISEADIQSLLDATTETDSQPTTETTKSSSSTPTTTTATTTATNTTTTLQKTADRPPIVTYPEFLTKPQRPPPLVTTNGLLNTLCACVGLSTLVYGASKYLVAPMVDNLNDSRLQIHDTTSTQLESLIAQLERTVSVIPQSASTGSAAKNDTLEESDIEDPAEMFHRDVGTQTSFPTSSANKTDSKTETPLPLLHATHVTKLTKILSSLRDDVRSQSTGFEGMKTQLDSFRDDLDTMTYRQNDFGSSSYEMFGAPRKNEPNDEIRTVRDNIRRIKGVLLSTRTFPASTR